MQKYGLVYTGKICFNCRIIVIILLFSCLQFYILSFVSLLPFSLSLCSHAIFIYITLACCEKNFRKDSTISIGILFEQKRKFKKNESINGSIYVCCVFFTCFISSFSCVFCCLFVYFSLLVEFLILNG